MKKIQIVLMAVLLAAGVGYSALLSLDFETNTVGSAPLGYAAIRPTAMTTTQYINTVSNTLLGGTKAVRYLDQSTQNASTGLEYNFVNGTNLGAVKFSASFSPSYTNGLSGDYIVIGVGAYGTGTALTLGSSANMYCEIRLTAAGGWRVYTNGNNAAGGTVGINTVNTFDMYINDTASTVSYLGGTLAPDTVDYWINGVLVQDDGALRATLAGGTTNGLGRIGFESSGARIGLDYLFDNITVEAIPEPATLGMVMLGALAIFGIRRYRG